MFGHASEWDKVGKDIPGDSVALSSNGTIVDTGSPVNGGTHYNDGSGQVRVHQLISNQRYQLTTDIEGIYEGDLFRHAVSLSSDGTMVAVTATHNTSGLVPNFIF